MCQGTVRGGRQCSRKQEPYCHQHQPTNVQLPMAPSALLPTKYVRRIETKIKKGPTKSDKAGWIYVFYKKSDKNDTFYKIGRTERDVEKRLNEWPGSILLCKFRVEYNKMAENLIHKYLAHVRAFRYLQDDGKYVSVWADTGEPVFKDTKDGKKSAKSKEIEWFVSCWSNLKPVVKGVCTYVNNLPT